MASESIPPSPPARAPAGSRSRLRKGAVLVVLFAALNVAAELFQVDLEDVGGRITTGSYALTTFVLPARSEDSAQQAPPRVILLGNSVLQYTEVDPALREQIRAAGLQFELGNFAQTGSSIADLLFAYEHIRKFEPDLLVIQVCPLTFGYDWPLFRTDNYKLGALPRYAHLLKLTPVRAVFDRNDYVEIATSSYLPLYRHLIPVRGGINNVLGARLEEGLGLPLLDFFPTRLNAMQEWGAAPRRATPAPAPQEYSGARELLMALLARLNADGQRTLIISQESTMPTLPLLGQLRHLAPSQHITFLDYSHHYEASKFGDHIHPTPEGAKDVAKRLLEAIRSSGLQAE